MRQIKNFMLFSFFALVLMGIFSFNFPVDRTLNLYAGKNEVKIAAWNNGAFDYYLPNGIKYTIEQIFGDSLDIEGTIDSISISDPDPHNSGSVPYLQYFISNHGQNTFFAHRVVKRLNASSNLWEFFITTDLGEELEETGSRVVKCSTVENCTGCRRVRTGFLGLGGIVECPCYNNSSLYCDYESTSGGFPWGPVLGFLGAVIAAIIAAS